MNNNRRLYYQLALFGLIALSSCGGVSYDEDGFARVEKKGKIGLYGPGKQMLLPCEYEEISYFDSGGYAIAKRNGKYGAINKEGKTVIQHVYFDLRDDHNGVFVGKKGNGLYVVIANVSGRFVESSGQFKSVNGFFGGSTSSAQSPYGDGYGLIDREGKEIMPFVFEEPFNLDSEGHAIVKQKGKYGIVDTNLKVIIPLAFDDNDIHFVDGIAIVKRDGRFGAIDKTSSILVPFNCSTQSEVRESLKNRWIIGTWRMVDGEITTIFTFYNNGKCFVQYRFPYPLPNAQTNYKYKVKNDEVTLIVPDDQDIVFMRISDKKMVTYDNQRREIKKIRDN